MISTLIASLFAAEMANMRRVVAGLFVLLFAAVLAALGIVFLFVAFHLWLTTYFAPWKAALLVSAAVFFAGLIMWLAGRASMRRRRTRLDVLAESVQATLAATDEDAKSGRNTLVAVVAAAMLGAALGRYLSR